MPRKKINYLNKYVRTARRAIGGLWRAFAQYWQRSWWHKTIVILASLALISLAGMYGIARWYIAAESKKPLTLGVSFIPDYAQYLGLNPQKTMDALINDTGVRHFRLVSYWSSIEPVKGKYDFSQLDWQFRKAEAAHAKITLVVGLRQPRWPECHMPDWAQKEPSSQWQPQLYSFIQAVAKRYKTSPSLDSYQLENEYFLHGFGICTNYDRQRLIDELHLLKKADSTHPVIITRSNNAIGFPVGQPQPDEFSISIYKRTWNDIISNATGQYLEYPWPAWYYGFLAGWQKIFLHKDMIAGEMQAETWPPHGDSILQTSLKEQNKTLDAKRLKGRFDYSEATGMRTIYMWGAEYWYYRKTVLHDPSLWNVAKQEFKSKDGSCL